MTWTTCQARWRWSPAAQPASGAGIVGALLDEGVGVVIADIEAPVLEARSQSSAAVAT